MKIGVKTFNDREFLKKFENDVDFFEIMAIQKNDYSFLKEFSLPIVIHAEHQNFGINPADISKKEKNINSLNFAIKLANKTNANKIIVHPGYIDEKNPSFCSIKNAIDFFNEINDERILIENLPKSMMFKLCYNPQQIKDFREKTNTGFCFDINHALQHLKTFNQKYDFIKEFISLNPSHYHIGGQKFVEKKEHLCLENSDLDLKKLLRYYPNNSEITLETEPNSEKTNKDLDIIKKVLNELF